MYQLETLRLYPTPNLRHLIHHYELIELRGRFPGEGLIVYPSLAVGLLFAFYRKQCIKVSNAFFGEKDMYPTTLLGATTKVAYNYDFGDLSLFKVVFMPGALSQLYGISLSPFTNYLAEGPTDLDRELTLLHERMEAQTAPSKRIALFEEYLMKKLAGKTISSKLYTAACRAMQGAPKDWSAQSMADRLGLSRRHLNRKFNEAFGLPVKTFLQVNRFCAALRHLHTQPLVSLSDTSYQFGYADQAHFSHEFKTMTGQSPKQHLRKIGKDDFMGPVEELEHVGYLINQRKLT